MISINISIAVPSNTYNITLSKEDLQQLNAGKTLMLEPSKTPICFRDFNVQFLTIKANNR